MDSALTWFIRGWVTLAVIVNVIAIGGIFVEASNFWDGWNRATEIYSPFNLWNVATEIILLSPAIGAYYWREQRRKAKLK